MTNTNKTSLFFGVEVNSIRNSFQKNTDAMTGILQISKQWRVRICKVSINLYCSKLTCSVVAGCLVIGVRLRMRDLLQGVNTCERGRRIALYAGSRCHYIKIAKGNYICINLVTNEIDFAYKFALNLIMFCL